MLASNGKIPKQRNNYFMSLDEISLLLKFLRKHYDPKWFLFVLIQFSLGLRCSECAAINIVDFKDKFKWLNYRQAKTNKMIYNEPVPEPLRLLIINYVMRNQLRLVDGYLFPNYSGKGSYYSTETIGCFWTKWRIGCAKEYKTDKWLDKYPQKDNKLRYRIGSHSLRRLHRTTLSKKISNDWLLAQLCHYDDMSSFLRYKNEFEVLENAEQLILPHMNPIVSRISDISLGQRSLNDFTRPNHIDPCV